MRSLFAILSLTLIYLGLVSRVSAMTVTPLTIELSSAGSNRSAQIVVRNEGASPVSLEIEVFRVELDENGGQARTPAPADFLVFPPARIIKPLGAQVFKIQWASAPLPSSKTYVLAVNQLPVQMPGDTSGVQFVYNFEVVANVAPPSGTRSLDVVSTGTSVANGKRFVNLLLNNSGNVHASLSEATVTFRSGSWSTTLQSGDLKQRLGVAVVQPGKRRRFAVPVDLPAEVKSVTAEILYEKNLH